MSDRVSAWMRSALYPSIGCEIVRRGSVESAGMRPGHVRRSLSFVSSFIREQARRTVRGTITDNQISLPSSQSVEHERDGRRKGDVRLQDGDVR